MKSQVGHVLDDSTEYNRDAIHVPIIAVRANCYLFPGDKVRLNRANDGEFWASSIGSGRIDGLVDPYLDEKVCWGQKFWCFLKPGSVKKLWHDWEHPLFDRPKKQ